MVLVACGLNVFLIFRTDTIVVLLVECGLILYGASLCCVTLGHRKAGRNNKYLQCSTAAIGSNHVKAMCGIKIILLNHTNKA